MKQTMQTTNDNAIAINSLKAWLLAARPKTLISAIVPVAIGVTLAWKDANGSGFQLAPALLCFLFAGLMQIDANFINDYYDCLKGNDASETRLGPKRACSEGWISLAAMRKGIIFTTLLASFVGLPLMHYGGWEMLIVGGLCIIFSFLYTTKFSYLGLGDLLVVIFFGIIPVCLSYYVSLLPLHQNITWEVFVLSFACGLVIDTLLVVNNYRDRELDEKAGKKTLVVHIGEKQAETLYFFLGVFAVIGAGNTSISSLFPAYFVYLYFHFATHKKLKAIKKGKALNQVLGATARNIFIFGFITVASILIVIFKN